jgi:hypothetical protein
LRSRIKETHINPVRTIIIADGNAGRQRWFSDATVIWLPDGGWSIALPNSLIWSQAALGPRP